jgi:hypothetical protein
MMQESGALIEITPEVREAVRRSADAGLRATPARVETGGILTGRINQGRLFINAAETVRCEHKYGAAYQLSPEECDQMRFAAEAIRSSSERHIAGYFRSCVGDRFRLFPDDEIIVREILSEAQFILLVKPLAAGVSMARMFERNAAGSWAEAGHFELVPGISQAPVPEPARSTAPDRRRFRWLPVAGGLVVIALLVLAWYQSSTGRPAPARSTSSLGLRIATQGDSFWLTWDRDSSAVKLASDGVLHILDGGGRRDIGLDAAQVRNGSVLYHPQSGDVAFNLELHRGGIVLGSEAIRALDGSKGLSTAEGTATPSPEIPTPTGTTFRSDTAALTAAVERTQRVFQPPDRIKSQPSASAAPSTENLPPPPFVIPRGPLVPDIPRSSTITKQTADASVVPPQPAPKQEEATQPLMQSEQAISQESPKVVATAAPAPQEPITAPAPTQPATDETLVTPPQPLRRVVPNMRNIAPQLLFEATTVDVQVLIDAAGRVLEARPVNSGKKINQALVGEAVKAAMQWTFEPARQDGKPIQATHVITFRFGRGS